jgi:hydroxymethylpyrimidine kinase/phosphomethylpyrimidine kinase
VKPVVCAIGTSEPWSAAGLALDVRALSELGVYPVLVIAAVSAQDGAGVRALHEIPRDVLEAQFRALESAPIAAYRIGALPSLASAHVVAAHASAADVPIVYDPALGASAGGALGTDGVEVARLLTARASLVTPNLSEASAMLGSVVTNVAQMHAAARALVELGAAAALVTGGHLPGEPVDVLCDAEGTFEFTGPRLPQTLRGTGCLLADAVAAQLSRGRALRAALEFARAYVRGKLANGLELGGMRVAE